ncbi:MAG: hypothetical protein D3910_20770 [Candidatus Electrothrix sp. ATG2]|nr:hypothetical protein [Candidatus Electrothrix sp. ATG2]
MVGGNKKSGLYKTCYVPYCSLLFKRISWLECTLEDKIPEYKEWVDRNIIDETEQLEQKRKIA